MRPPYTGDARGAYAWCERAGKNSREIQDFTELDRRKRLRAEKRKIRAARAGRYGGVHVGTGEIHQR